MIEEQQWDVYKYIVGSGYKNCNKRFRATYWCYNASRRNVIKHPLNCYFSYSSTFPNAGNEWYILLIIVSKIEFLNLISHRSWHHMSQFERTLNWKYISYLHTGGKAVLLKLCSVTHNCCAAQTMFRDRLVQCYSKYVHRHTSAVLLK
jgi:hypothetical protein